MDSSNAMVSEKKRKPMVGCGIAALCRTMFRRRSRMLPRRPPSANSNTLSGVSRAAVKLSPFHLGRHSAGADQTPLVAPGDGGDSLAPAEKPRSAQNSQVPGRQNATPQRGRKAVLVPGIFSELDSMIYDHQREAGNSALIRASSGNVMLFGNLGNLRVRNAAVDPARNKLDELPKTAQAAISIGKTGHGNLGAGGPDSAMGRCPNAKDLVPVPLPPTKGVAVAPEELNHMGSVEYRKGRLAEALTLFEKATIAAPEKALYWNNKAVVLTGMGRLLEAVTGCKEAVKVDRSYCRAHYQLATLYLRLGKVGSAMPHYKQARGEASDKDLAQARALQNHLTKCSEARKSRDWQNMIKEAQTAITTGAISAPKVFALQAEALLKLQRHQEAETALIGAPTFDIDASISFFGAADSSYVLAVQAQVDMALGRFVNAVKTAQRAALIDPRNVENAAVARRARAVSLARTKGNDLFKASKFQEACAAFGEGLNHDPQNSVLLCNRATCQSKLGQWEKSIEDCNVALKVRPSYKRARLRRAGCYAKLERWEDSIEDYKVLIQQLPGDEEVLKALSKVHSQLREIDTGSKDINPRTNSVVNTNDQFTHLST